MEVPAAYLYTPAHIWVRHEDGHAVIGLTEMASAERGLAIFVELPVPGETLAAGSYVGYIETADKEYELRTPLSGRVSSINTALERGEALWLHERPYSQGWLFTLELTAPEELAALWSAERYEAYTGAAGK